MSDKPKRASEYIAHSRGADRWTIAEDRGWYVLWERVGRHTRKMIMSTDNMRDVLAYIETAARVERSDKP